MNCPSCGKPMNQEMALRGVNPHYYHDTGYRCQDMDCDAHGMIWFTDTSPADNERLLEINRTIRAKYMKIRGAR